MYNIIKSVDLPDYLLFKSECACLDHDLHIVIEKDEGQELSLKVFDDYYITDGWYGDGWFKRLLRRVSCALRLLFTGYCKINYEFGFKNQGHINEFVEFLNDSLKRINEGSGDDKADSR